MCIIFLHNLMYKDCDTITLIFLVYILWIIIMFYNNSRLSKWYISKNILASLILHIKLHQMLNATLDQGEVVQRCLSYPTCKQRGRESKPAIPYPDMKAFLKNIYCSISSNNKKVCFPKSTLKAGFGFLLWFHRMPRYRRVEHQLRTPLPFLWNQ